MSKSSSIDDLNKKLDDLNLSPWTDEEKLDEIK